MQIIAIVVSLTIAAVGIALFVRAIRSIIGVLKVGQPAGRTDNPAGRTVTMVKETLGHTRMLQWTLVGAAHWFVFVGFGLLFFTLLTAFGQLFDAHFALPLIGHFFLWEWVSELFTVVMLVAIVGFIAYRSSRPTERVRGPRGRFFGSTMWQGYFVEAVILGVGLCIMLLRGLEYALLTHGGEHSDNAGVLHFPFSFPLGEAFSGLSVGTTENLIYLIAMLKIVISFAWMITISLNTTMGVAWHRFTAFFNIWFKREATGGTALGAIKPLTSAGKPITLDDIDDLDEDATLGVGRAEDFSWKGILDFTTCTECGRCQSQCPAWNTDKPLSPKLLITALRDHTYAKAPYLQAGSDEERAALLEGNDTLVKEVERPLVGDTGDSWFYMPEDGSAVIDPDVLWSCTSCGACVQQCPVDIEHVDHIMDMRRYQLLVESNFPAELNQLFKGLENKGNPWNMSPTARMDWAKGLEFEVPVVGEDLESLESVDWLFWVGCAGAYEDRAKKTTRAVAELLNMAGISFGVLGNGETCTGDPARRAGNEFVFQGLASANVETFQEFKVKKVVSTCAHCFNTLKNEYKDFGIELEVVHHTQLLNRLVRDGRLTPIKEGAGAEKRSITYHDPCYLGRHNQVYSPPRELLQVLPGAEYKEMERHSEKSFCCGAGGARMWMEENIGERINVNRTKEAVSTGADQIAVGCPFCRVMLSDGLTAEQANGGAREEVEVLDVAQMLLASVKGEVATRVRASSGTATATAGAASTAGAAAGAGAAGAAAGAGTAGAGTATVEAGSAADEATAAEPAAGDATQTEETVTETADAGPAAKASGGSSLFDVETEEEPAPAAAPSGGSSLFDVESPTDSGQSAPTGGASLFDVESPTDSAPSATEAPAEARTEARTEAEAPEAAEPPATPDQGLGSGSLFDIAAPAAPAPAAASTSPEREAKPEPEAETPAPAAREPGPVAAESSAQPTAETSIPRTQPATEIPEGGSLFDLEAPAAPAPAARTEPTPEPEAEAGAPSEPTPEAQSEPESTPEAQSEPEATPEAGPESAAPAEGLSGGAALSRAATFAVNDPEPGASAGSAESEDTTPEPEADVDREPQAEPQPEPEPQPAPAEPEPASSVLHTPRTDVDINESGSLFDL